MNFSKNDQENVDNIIDKVSDLVLDSLSKDLEEKTIII